MLCDKIPWKERAEILKYLSLPVATEIIVLGKLVHSLCYMHQHILQYRLYMYLKYVWSHVRLILHA